MAKPPPPMPPTVGDRVRLRGRAPVGIVKWIGNEMSWCEVEWDAGPQGPRLVHLHEIEKQ